MISSVRFPVLFRLAVCVSMFGRRRVGPCHGDAENSSMCAAVVDPLSFSFAFGSLLTLFFRRENTSFSSFICCTLLLSCVACHLFRLADEPVYRYY